MRFCSWLVLGGVLVLRWIDRVGWLVFLLALLVVGWLGELLLYIYGSYCISNLVCLCVF